MTLYMKTHSCFCTFLGSDALNINQNKNVFNKVVEKTETRSLGSVYYFRNPFGFEVIAQNKFDFDQILYWRSLHKFIELFYIL
jgi:hypothetical protein